MHVEDHPLEYGTFEGVIPEGYGAGVVMLWDQGTWTPESDDVDEALKRGDLKMTLDGYKLKGSWVLVRTKGWSGGARGGSGDAGKSWLLIKHRDDWAGPIDITTFAPNSVKSGGGFRDILLQEAPDVWRSHQPGAGAQGDEALRKIAAKVIELEGDAEPEAQAPKPRAPKRTRAGQPAATTPARAAKSVKNVKKKSKP
jgi:bifunctional non-homologous end joining protein LigD